MGVDITGPTIPRRSNIENFTVAEDATPKDPGSTSGGIGQVTATMGDWEDSLLLMDDDIVVEDATNGKMLGTVRSLDSDGVTVALVADSELGKFNVERTAQPFQGKLSALVQYYADLADIHSLIAFNAPDIDVVVPGFIGNLWDHMKWLMAAHQIELGVVDTTIEVRPLRRYVADLGTLTGPLRYAVNTQTAARAVEVNFYNHKWVVDGEVFPLLTEEPTIQQVDARETTTWEVRLNASLESVNQPVHVYTVGPGSQAGTKGVYTVVGNDDLPITPAQWAAEGGKVEVRITEDPSVIEVIVTGARNDYLAPFRIAMSAGGDDYNSLHITGTGVVWDVRTALIHTGADPNVVSEEIGTTVDNIFLSTRSQAYRAGQHTAAAYSGLTQTLSGAATSIGLPDDEQPYGNTAGARIITGDIVTRIDTATYDPAGISFSSTVDTTLADFDEVWAGKTMAEFNEAFFNNSLKDFSLRPLRKG